MLELASPALREALRAIYSGPENPGRVGNDFEAVLHVYNVLGHSECSLSVSSAFYPDDLAHNALVDRTPILPWETQSRTTLQHPFSILMLVRRLLPYACITSSPDLAQLPILAICTPL